MPTPKEDTVKKGDLVKVEYIGTLEDGTVFDDTVKHGPLEFIVGADEVIKGFDKAVVGMKVGQEKEVKMKPEDAYGKIDPKQIKKVTKDELPKEDWEVGMDLCYIEEDGQEIPGVITEIKGNSVTVDLNHPLAGEILNFKIKLLSKGDPPGDDDDGGPSPAGDDEG